MHVHSRQHDSDRCGHMLASMSGYANVLSCTLATSQQHQRLCTSAPILAASELAAHWRRILISAWDGMRMHSKGCCDSLNVQMHSGIFEPQLRRICWQAGWTDALDGWWLCPLPPHRCLQGSRDQQNCLRNTICSYKLGLVQKGSSAVRSMWKSSWKAGVCGRQDASISHQAPRCCAHSFDFKTSN